MFIIQPNKGSTLSSTLEKYDKLITAVLVIIAFIFGVGWWFAGEKSEPVYLSKIDKLMFDKDNKAPKFVLTLPDKLIAKEKHKTSDVVIEAIQQQPQTVEKAENNDEFSLEKLLKTVPLLQNLPDKTPTQTLDFVDLNEEMREISANGSFLPKVSEDGSKPWVAYGKAVKIQPNFKKIAVVVSGLGFDMAMVNKTATAFDSELSMSFTPYTSQPEDAIKKARTSGHETYIDFLLPSKDFFKEDTGPLSLPVNLSLEEASKRFHDTISKPAPFGGLIIRDGLADNSNSIMLSNLFNEAQTRGLLIVDATAENGIDNIKVDGLARRKADIVITRDLVKEEIEALLKKAENIAFDKGQVLIVSDAKPIILVTLHQWINTFSPQVSYEEAKTVDISKPFALVPVSNLVVE